MLSDCLRLAEVLLQELSLSHKVDDDLPLSYKILKLRYNPFICFRNSKS